MRPVLYDCLTYDITFICRHVYRLNLNETQAVLGALGKNATVGGVPSVAAGR